jgi:hypothetical protein
MNFTKTDAVTASLRFRNSESCIGGEDNACLMLEIS